MTETMSNGEPTDPTPPSRPKLSPWRILLLLGILGAVIGLGAKGVSYLERPDAEAADTWFAPYVDTTLTPHFSFEDRGVNPGLDVVLGFVVADGDHGCTPSWGDAYTIEEASTGLDLDRRIARYRKRGGDVIVSFGGLTNNELAVTCDDEEELAEAYEAVVDRYEPTTLDFDIEGDALDDRASIKRRARALAQVQKKAHRENRDLTIWLTLPVTPNGLLPNGLEVVDSMLDAGVDIGGVNLMTMNFGSSRGDDSMAQATETSLRAAHRQLGSAYKRADTRLSDADLWAKLGATPMIGVNDVNHDVFTPNDARELRSFARQQGLGRVSLWSANRDLPCPSSVDIESASNHCSGVEQEPLLFTEIFSGLTGRPAANAGRRTVPVEVIVDDPETSPYPLWHEKWTYEEGDKVVRRGQVYQAKWWTRGDDPDIPVINDWDTPWALVGPVLPTDRPSTSMSAHGAGT